MAYEHVHECHACGARWDEDHDEALVVYQRAFEFIEALADGGGITVNGIPWREAYERLQAIVSDGLPLPPAREPVNASADCEGGDRG